jgi:uncharacterized protein (TIGR00255 family)
MTAYGRGEYTQGGTVFTAEIKSYNNRYRDLILRTPRALHILEDEIKSQIFSRIRRGRVEVFIQMGRNGKEPAYDLELNLPLVRSYFQIFKQLQEEFGLDQKIRPNDLCQMKDVILFKPEDVDMDEAKAGLQEVLCLALDSFDLMRNQEGRAIEEDFQKRINLIGGYLDSIEDRTPMVGEEYRTRLKDKINNILQDIKMDESRLIQEVAIFADRCDITEEIVRTRSHLKQFHHYMAKDDSIGRRLEFLLQEINREVNTISSKASDSFISAKAVEIKAELEKLREQVQNVE